ncbi:MAG: 16S rRNA (cytosine(1402)-N(4))-methyltransferase RsmH [Endomicrobium sp.]|nr:16S rRNA (cytosine(1402)-N(4))-methyltransferase RsmH [Endomicrobium sp.]
MCHISVMPLEVSQYLVNKSNGLYVDCTFGFGGHTSLLLNKFKDIKIVAFDWDKDSEDRFLKREKGFGGRVIFIRDNFKNIKSRLSSINVNKVDGILADIGVSSKQFDDLNRGFSFNSCVLDMRMDKRNELTAKEVINSFSRKALASIFYRYGEEYKSRQITKAIFLHRKKGVINSAKELRDIVCSVKKTKYKIDPATKVFQALRIFVNDELENVETLVSVAPGLLNTKGRIVVVSFHSLEDRIVKQNFKQNLKDGKYKILTKKIVTPTHEEIRINPRIRSAKMRVAEKI